jgi:hypothetical protein
MLQILAETENRCFVTVFYSRRWIRRLQYYEIWHRLSMRLFLTVSPTAEIIWRRWNVNEYKVLVEWRWQKTVEVLGEKLVPVRKRAWTNESGPPWWYDWWLSAWATDPPSMSYSLVERHRWFGATRCFVLKTDRGTRLWSSGWHSLFL